MELWSDTTKDELTEHECRYKVALNAYRDRDRKQKEEGDLNDCLKLG